MEKQVIPREDGMLKHVCNEAYFGVRRIATKFIDEKHIIMIEERHLF